MTFTVSDREWLGQPSQILRCFQKWRKTKKNGHKARTNTKTKASSSQRCAKLANPHLNFMRRELFGSNHWKRFRKRNHYNSIVNFVQPTKKATHVALFQSVAILLFSTKNAFEAGVTGPGVRRGAARTRKSRSSFPSWLNSLWSGSVEGAPPLGIQLQAGHISAKERAAKMLYSKFLRN